MACFGTLGAVVPGVLMNITFSSRGSKARGTALGLLFVAWAVPTMCLAADCFKVMEATLYADKPDMRALGIQTIKLVEPPRWWHGVANDGKSLKEATVRATNPLVGETSPVLIDLELALAGNSPEIVANRQRYLDVIQWMREGGFKSPLSFYGSLPVRDYWRSLKSPGSPDYKAWQAENDALRPIAAQVTALYPSLYTFYADPQGWVKYARANIAEARRIGGGKPVYPFIWPQFHNSNKSLGYQYIDGTFWSSQLRTLHDQADGLVIWGGWDFTNNRHAPWDENAAWWRATKEFLANTPNLCRVSAN
jgi:hypothetical protein